MAIMIATCFEFASPGTAGAASSDAAAGIHSLLSGFAAHRRARQVPARTAGNLTLPWRDKLGGVVR
jgi:hypothetical protein